jgi:hypothetical protein
MSEEMVLVCVLFFFIFGGVPPEPPPQNAPHHPLASFFPDAQPSRYAAEGGPLVVYQLENE